MALFEEHPTKCTYKQQPSECGVSSLHTDQNSVKKRIMNKDLKLEWLSRDNMSSSLFALVSYRHVKNSLTHLLHRS